MEDNSEEVREQRSRGRRQLIEARIVEILLSSDSPYHARLSQQERDEVARDPGAALRAKWFDGDGQLTSVGAQRLGELEVTDSERQGLVTTLMVRGQVPEEPLAGENLGKGRADGLVVTGNNFDLTADASPTGGSNLEWITDPLTSLAEVTVVMDNVTAMARYLDGRRSDAYIPSEDVTAGGGTPEPRLRIYPDGNFLSFAPQATFGARLERLPKLIDYLENRRPMSVMECVPVLGSGRVDLLKNWEHLTEDERDMVGDEAGARAVHKSLGALGAQQNLVGPQGDQEAIVAELRRMKDNVTTAELKPLAVAVFTLIERLNAKQPLRYEKGQ